MNVVIAIPLAHTWLWPHSCLARLFQFNPGDVDYHIVVVDNSWEWATAGYHISDIWKGKEFDVVTNDRHSHWHGTALDYVVEHYDAEWLFAMETDVLALRDGWLQWYIDKAPANHDVFAIGHWHGEQFINPSATLYNMPMLKRAMAEFRSNKDPNMYWGPNFERSDNILAHYDKFLEDVGPFSEKRGWRPGTVVDPAPTGQLRGPGWYEPGQQVYHWAEMNGFRSIVLPCSHVCDPERSIPVGTFYGTDPYYIVHTWGGTRALDILKHPVSDPTVNNNMGFWLEREAEVFRTVVPTDIQDKVIDKFNEVGWYNRLMSDREKEASRLINGHYRRGGINLADR